MYTLSLGNLLCQIALLYSFIDPLLVTLQCQRFVKKQPNLGHFSYWRQYKYLMGGKGMNETPIRSHVATLATCGHVGTSGPRPAGTEPQVR